MKRRTLLTAVAISVMALGCAWAQDVRYNFDKDADFSKFKTYKWVVLKDATPMDNIMDKNIKSAVDAQLATKGLTKVDEDPADLYIGYQGAVGTEKQFTSYDTSWGYGGGWYGRGWYGGGPSSSMSTGQTSTIYVGQLSIDMYETSKKDLVWRGLVSKTLDPKAKPEKQEKNLNKALTKLFKNYPPKPKS
jgi:Domain of unknown function (DUF4136)